ncbi:TrmB family transcriptional regulator [Halobacterium jilantaiense]|uniref:Sugar-specific transcriptional regulator TrmB n=1 Tax=Halobacterium jilantaiense TaxID=355548 RepID=A0A1I0MFD2_9EURY|nr:helix-turn-helix domain-containing protein [Halobacterium jilantaiense]SEV86992.1 Sugar-specific transcriptional regulator TrmB [Halobacterium jilantaiense]
MNEGDAVDALKSLGLTTYEARTFVALQKLGAGTASEVAEIAEVPRSQVYGAAEDLEGRGLVDVEQSNPTRYRPVGIEEARERLYRQLRSESDAAFDYLESVRSEYGTDEEESEAIWTVRGSANVAARATRLVASAENRVVYGTEHVQRLGPSVREALADAVEAGVAVTVISEADDVLDVAREIGARAVAVGHELMPEMGTERVVMADDDAVLVSVGADDGSETAFWSRDTAFATMLSSLLGEFVATVAGDQ